MDHQADGLVADAWDEYIGNADHRLAHYAEFLVEFLRKQKCHDVLDVACGTGIDSIMLLEHGFKVTSVDGSENMVKVTSKKRLERRNEKGFDDWVIQQANWLTLHENLAKPDEGFDAIICIGNSITHLNDLVEVKLAIQNFHHMLKPGGWLVIDHRNFDAVKANKYKPRSSIYYNGSKFSNSTLEQTSEWIIRNVCLEVPGDKETDSPTGTEENGTSEKKKCTFKNYTLQLGDFTGVLECVFGQGSKHELYGDYKPLETMENPGFFVHFIQKEQ